jgi:pimeloyl-ACP methyl ester carboxylesterase
MPYLVALILFAEFSYVLGMLYMYIAQRKFLYKPERNLDPPSYYGFNKMEDFVLESSDGVQCGVWFQKPLKPEKPIILYFHGNAGHIGDRVEKIVMFLRKGYGICAPSYRGFGTSGGAPSEVGIYRDAEAAYAFLLGKGFAPEQILIYGESLGSGVAVELASRYKNIRGLALEAPYTAVVDRGSEMYPYLPVYLLMHDYFDSISKIPNIRVPLLIFHGKRDETMPCWHGERLLAAANNPKKGVFFDKVDHTSFDPMVLVEEMEGFFVAKA